MQRAPTVIAFLLFLVLCASIAYWLLQWMAPPPRAVAAPPQAARAEPAVAAAANLFGGRAAAGMANVQLKGILRTGSPKGSIAIIAIEGKPARALPANAEISSGLTVREINTRSVVLSDRGAERELTLPAFAAQEGAMSSVPGRSPEPQPVASPVQQPAPQQQQPAQPQPPQLPPTPQASGPSSSGTSAAGGPTAPNAQAPMYGQRPPAIAPPSEPGFPAR